MLSSDSTDVIGTALSDDARRVVLTAARGPEPAGVAPDLLDRFRAQVVRRPEHLAVVASDGALTYQALGRVTDLVAKRLRQAGVQAGARVAVSMPRGARELVAFLAILEVEAAYVPIDETHPLDRVRLILADAQPRV